MFFVRVCVCPALTDGVNAFLIKYYYIDNSNIWFWFVQPDDDLKGMETLKSDKDRVFGYAKQKASDTIEGGKKALGTIPRAEWEKEKFEKKDFKDQENVGIPQLEAEIEEFKKAGEQKPIDVAEIPTVDYTDAVNEVIQLSQVLKSSSSKAA